MTFNEIMANYLQDSNNSKIQEWLESNHHKIFYKNTIQRESPFVCGIAYGMLHSFMHKTSNEYVPSWFYRNFSCNHITCIDDSAIKWAKEIADLIYKHATNKPAKFRDGVIFFSAFFETNSINLDMHENLEGKLALFIY